MNWQFTRWLPRILSDYRHRLARHAFDRGKEACAAGLESIISSVTEDPDGYWITRRTDQSMFQVSDHLCQVVFAESGPNFYEPSQSTGTARHWIFFDNAWAAANPHLVESILRYGRGANVLG